MKTTILTQTGTGTTNWWRPNPHLAPFQVTAGVITTGTVTYNIETTQDNFWDYPTGTIHATIYNGGSAQTGGLQLSIQDAVDGIRLNMTAGTGTATLYLTQAGITNY